MTAPIRPLDRWETSWNVETGKYETKLREAIFDNLKRPVGNPGPFGMEEEDE